MNAADLRAIFDASALAATAPLLVLTAGVLLLLLLEIFPSAAAARPFVFVGTLLVAGACHAALTSGSLLVLDGTYLADGATSAWGVLFLLSTFIAWLQSRRYYEREAAFLGEHDLLMLTAAIGMTLMAGAQDLVVFFIGLELLSIPLYCLAAFRRSRDESVEAGVKYFVLGAFGVAFFLYGAALLYTASGTLSLVELRGIGAHGPLAVTGVALMVASLFFKLGIFPFHLWVPDVYQGSPTPVTTLMVTGTKAAAFAFLLRATFLLPVEAAASIGVFAVLTMAAGNLGALLQADLKRMLAWSGVAHAGTLLLVVAGALAGGLEREAMNAALYYMAAYVFTAGGAFGLIAWLEADGERFTKIESLRGLARRRPGVAAAMTLFMLSLGGIPATGGFLGKWLVFSVAVEAGLVGLALVGVLLSVVALAYYLRVVVAMYMQPEVEGLRPPTAQRPAASFAAALCAVMVLVLGLLPAVFLDRLL